MKLVKSGLHSRLTTTIVFAVVDVIKKLRTVHVKIMPETKVMDLCPILNLNIRTCRDAVTRMGLAAICRLNYFPSTFRHRKKTKVSPTITINQLSLDKPFSVATPLS